MSKFDDTLNEVPLVRRGELKFQFWFGLIMGILSLIVLLAITALMFFDALKDRPFEKWLLMPWTLSLLMTLVGANIASHKLVVAGLKDIIAVITPLWPFKKS